MDKELQSLRKGSKKLYKDVEALEDALTLHQRFKEEDENSIRGMIRKEIGGARWEHGGSGKMHSYRSAKDLNENTDTASTKRAQRRQKNLSSAKVGFASGSVIKTTNAGTKKQRIEKEKESKVIIGTDPEQVLQVKVKGIGDHGDDVETLIGMSSYNVSKVAEMKNKVLEKASTNVIKRKKTKVSEDTVQKTMMESKKKKENATEDGKGIVKNNMPDKPNIEHHRSGRNALASEGTANCKRTRQVNSAEEQIDLISDNSNRKNVKQTNRLFTDFREEDSQIINTDLKNIGTPTESGKNSKPKFRPGDKLSTSQSKSSSKNQNSANHSETILHQKHLLRKSLNCDPDVHLWLRQLGLLEEDKYVRMFADNEIDMEVLVSLDERQLEKMGVTALGAMKKIVKGIEELRSSQKKGNSDVKGRKSQTENTNNNNSNDIRKAEVRKSLHEVHTRSSEMKKSAVDKNGPEIRKSKNDKLLRTLSSETEKLVNNEIVKEPVNMQSKSSSQTTNGEGRIATLSMSNKDSTSANGVKNKPTAGGISKDDQYSKFARTSTQQMDKGKLNLRRSNSFHSRTNTESEIDTLQTEQLQRRPDSSKDMAGRRRDDSLTRKGSGRGKAEGSTSSKRVQGKERPKSVPKLPRGRTSENVKKKVEEGVTTAARKFEERAKMEAEDEKRRQRELEKQRAFRDQMAARHIERKKTQEEDLDDSDDSTDDDDDDDDDGDSDTQPLTQLIGVKISTSEKRDKEVKPPISKQDKGHDRVTSKIHVAKPPVRQSMAVPANSMQLMPDFTGAPQKSARTSTPKSYTRYSYSARKNTVKDIETQIERLQKKALAGEMVTMDLVKNLQKRLEEIESTIKKGETPSAKGNNSSLRKHERVLQEESEAGRLKGDSDLPTQPKTKEISLSVSKKELLKEIRREKMEHRKQIRHLHSELNRMRQEDPVKGVEADMEDVDFQESDLIGEGAFSKVYHGVYQGTDVAVKQLKVPLSPQDRNYFAAEVSLLRDLKHPMVVTLLGVITSGRYPLMILEYMAKGSLYHLLHDSTRDALDHAEFYRYAHDIALGMNYLHQHKPAVLHLDLKSMNVLICSNDRAKIADFGFSKFRHDADMKATQSSKLKPVRASPIWMAPELLETGEITPKADVYSFAIILWEMLTRKQPYEGCSVFQVLERTRLNKRPDIPETCPGELAEFIKQCWNPLPSRRPSFKEILQRLENMAFPPDWQALLKEAGVPPVALEDVESTRTIISLVNNTLDTENVKTMVEEVRKSCDEVRWSCDSFGLNIFDSHDYVEMYSPRSPKKSASDQILKHIHALGSEETFAEADDSYIGYSTIRSNRERVSGGEPTLSVGPFSPKSMAESLLKSQEKSELKSDEKKEKETKDMGTSTSADLTTNTDGTSTSDSVELKSNSVGMSTSVELGSNTKSTSTAKESLCSAKERVSSVDSPQKESPRQKAKESKMTTGEGEGHKDRQIRKYNQPASSPKITKEMLESMAKDRRVAIVSKSVDLKNLRESIHSQIKQSPKVLRMSRDISGDEKARMAKITIGSKVEGTLTKGSKSEDKLTQGSKSEDKQSGIEEKPVLGAKSEDYEKPVPTPRNVVKNVTQKKLVSVEDLNSQLKRKLSERNKKKLEEQSQKQGSKDAKSNKSDASIVIESPAGLKASKTAEKSGIDTSSKDSPSNFVEDSLNVEKDENPTPESQTAPDVTKEVDDVSEIENDSLENSPRDSLEDVSAKTEEARDKPFRIVSDNVPKFENSVRTDSVNGNNDNCSHDLDWTMNSEGMGSEKASFCSFNNSLKSARQSIEAWVEEKPDTLDRTSPARQKGRKVTPPSSHFKAPPPILIPANPPPPPPPAPPIPAQDDTFLVVRPADKEPKKFTAKIPTTTNTPSAIPENVEFTVQSVELRQQKEMLQSTTKPHPNQLHDLSVVSRGTMSSIAEILKRAVFDRRVAMGEDFSPSHSVTSSWSFMDD